MREHYEQQLITLSQEVTKIAQSKSSTTARPPTFKLPTFDLDKDKEGFQLWKGRWENHLRAHRIHTIADEEERKERMLVELLAALSDETHKWIAHREFTVGNFLTLHVEKYQIRFQSSEYASEF